MKDKYEKKKALIIFLNLQLIHVIKIMKKVSIIHLIWIRVRTTYVYKLAIVYLILIYFH